MRKRIRGSLSYSNVMSTLCFFLLLSGGMAYAAGQLGKNTVGPKQLKKNAVTAAKIKKQAVTTAKLKNQAVTAAKVKNGTLTGTQINVSTLGTVPSAQQANTLAAPEGWHEVGAPGQPGYENNWKQANPAAYNAAFFKDHEGIVHLRGIINGGTASTIFHLPPGYRPAAGKISAFLALCTGGSCPAGGVGVLGVFGTIGAGLDGAVSGSSGGTMALEGISFRAES
jgi:hypothetical protein